MMLSRSIEVSFGDNEKIKIASLHPDSLSQGVRYIRCPAYVFTPFCLYVEAHCPAWKRSSAPSQVFMFSSSIVLYLAASIFPSLGLVSCWREAWCWCWLSSRQRFASRQRSSTLVSSEQSTFSHTGFILRYNFLPELHDALKHRAGVFILRLKSICWLCDLRTVGGTRPFHSNGDENKCIQHFHVNFPLWTLFVGPLPGFNLNPTKSPWGVNTYARPRKYM